MRAAQIVELGSPPQVAEVDDPAGRVLEVEAVALNPLDLAIGNGRFYAGHPPLPYIPGCEAVGRVDGRRVYAFGDGRGVAKDGFAAERAPSLPDELLIDVPEDVDAAVAAAAGIAGLAAWIPVAWKARVTPDDTVLVLGATGLVGQIALQAAKHLGAARVVACGRDRARLERALELGADEAVELGELADVNPTVVIDPLWGEPAAAAAGAAAPGARIVHIGQSAGPEATFTSADVRSKQLTIMGHSNFGLTPAERARAYGELLELLVAGRIRIDLETFPLADVAAAWERQASGAGKAVLVVDR